MADGWREWLRTLLVGAAKSLERQPAKMWTQEQQRAGIAVTIAVMATTVIWLFAFMIFDSHIEKSHDVVAVVEPPQSLLKQEKWLCQRSEDNRASDLCAQWKAADAARKAADWSVTAFIIGTGVNVLTLLVVALGWMETRRASKSSEEQVRIAKSQMETELRPWIGVKATVEGKFFKSTDTEVDEVTVQIVYQIENFGKRPAIDLTIDAKLVFTSFGARSVWEKFNSFKNRTAYSASGYCILPGEKRNITDFPSANFKAAQRLGGIFKKKGYKYMWPAILVLVRYRIDSSRNDYCLNGFVSTIVAKNNEDIGFDLSRIFDVELKVVDGFDHHLI